MQDFVTLLKLSAPLIGLTHFDVNSFYCVGKVMKVLKDVMITFVGHHKNL